MDQNLFRFIWRHSHKSQIAVLLLILLSLPFYFASLDIPKTIVNQAIQGKAFVDGNTTAPLFKWAIGLPDWLGGGTYQISEGIELNQTEYLFALSFLFLALVLTTGAFKAVINISKGVLGERMLRRFRFQLFERLLRFSPEHIRSVKPAEAASMINNEAEPIGGFIGEAFIQPAFLTTQALTAVLFIMLQSFWLGMVAVSIVLVQAVIIPYLRREQLRLARMRQLAARQLAGRIGEVVDSAPAIHIHGASAYNAAEIGGRLGNLFDIRMRLFKRKFLVKYLNNLLAKITPFFFYAIGGYFALRGQLDIGQLIAVIAAYRDLPPPIKELIDWDQQRNDVTVKYQQILTQFGPERLRQEDTCAHEPPAPDEPVRLSGLRIVDHRGTSVLDSVTATLPRPAHIALSGSSASARDLFARVLGRQVSDYSGSIQLGGYDLATLPETTACRVLAYNGPEPFLFSGSIRDNVLFSLKRHIPDVTPDDQLTAEQCRMIRESRLSGNPTVTAEADWIDYAAAGVTDAASLDEAILEGLAVVGLTSQIYRFGLQGRLCPDTSVETLERVVTARRSVLQHLEEQCMSDLIEPFDPATYNNHMTIGENLIFGIPVGERLTAEGLLCEPYIHSILEAEALQKPLLKIGIRMAETTLEVFAEVAPDSPLLEQHSFIPPEDIETFRDIVGKARQSSDLSRMPAENRAKLLDLALRYVEPAHRLGLATRSLRERVLRGRQSFRQFLPFDVAEIIEFYDPDKVIMAAPVGDNLLFGRVSNGIAKADEKIAALLESVLVEHNLMQTVYALGLDYDVGSGGKSLFPVQRASIAIARSLICRPDMLVVDGALSSFSASEAEEFVARLRLELAGKTLIISVPENQSVDDYDQVIRFEGSRVSVGPPRNAPVASQEKDATPVALAEVTAAQSSK